eukprot:GGOE01046243.1.p1 GENE.GGOE01046243.1~~GGOE01046243.1.p1  ORF type:complete len:603 (+),score=127.87 GGOE01046243.1:199-1809(+)
MSEDLGPLSADTVPVRKGGDTQPIPPLQQLGGGDPPSHDSAAPIGNPTGPTELLAESVAASQPQQPMGPHEQQQATPPRGVAPECTLAVSSSAAGKPEHPDVYATLVVLGPREALMDQNSELVEVFGRNNDDFVLRRKEVGNGIQLAPSTRSYLDAVAPKFSATLGVPGTGHSLREESSPSGRGAIRSITLSACKTYTHAVKFDFVEATDFDMWQMGRMEPTRNDWQIIGYHNDADYPVSRYAFRILACRQTGRCWVYAGGFDQKGDLFLNPHTIRWGAPPYDAFTTCGLLLWVPRLRSWCEVSVMGQLYSLRPCHNMGGKKLHDPELTNELEDGSLIHIAGSTILFRKGDFQTDEADDSRAVVHGLQALQQVRPRCPVQIETLRFLCKADGGNQEGAGVPDGLSSGSGAFASGSYMPNTHMPLVFTTCGHVLGNTPQNAALDTCPLCRHKGPSTPLRFDYHKALVASPPQESIPTHVFHPCGHATTEAQAQYWCSIPIPGISNHFVGDWSNTRHTCPFCNLPLDSAQPYTKLHLT